jgi:hypothetical protein
VDALGNVYVTGKTWGSGPGTDYTTIKYDSGGSGSQLWVRHYSGNGNDYATALAVDALGNVYVTGQSEGIGTFNVYVTGQSEGIGTFHDYATIKYTQSSTRTGDRFQSEEDEGRSEEFALLQNCPNPFNPDTWIPYQLKEDSHVVIRIYATTGQLVRTLNLGHKPAGFYMGRSKAAHWDGRNKSGESVSSGIYFYQIQAGEFSATRKMTILK